MWQFADSVSPDRSERLTSLTGIDAVVAAVLSTAQVAGFEWEPFKADRLRDCHRASFLLRVSEPAYDAFFNSPAGYRGQFARSIDLGESANRTLLSSLEPLLLANPSSDQTALGSIVVRSLSAIDAKCWIFEPEIELHMGRTEPEILFGAWQYATEDGAGLLAPVGTCLEVKGGWLDGGGLERRDPFKSSRSKDIHDVGYC